MGVAHGYHDLIFLQCIKEKQNCTNCWYALPAIAIMSYYGLSTKPDRAARLGFGKLTYQAEATAQFQKITNGMNLKINEWPVASLHSLAYFNME